MLETGTEREHDDDVPSPRLPVWRVDIDREVKNYDRFTRFIEAPSEKEAWAIAERMANAADRNCPDDAGPGGFDDELGDWFVNDVAASSDEEALSEAYDVLTADELPRD